MLCKAEKNRFPSLFEGGGGYYFLDSCNCNRVISIVGPMIRCRLYPVSHHSLKPNSLFSKLFFDFSNILKEPITIKMAKRVLIFQGFFSEELMVGTLLSFLFFLVADSVKWYNCFSYSISNSCLDVKITWFVNNANCVAKSRLVN